jgi:hypothetical protein
LQLQVDLEQQLELKQMAPETLGDMSSLFKEYSLAMAESGVQPQQFVERRTDTQLACTAATVLATV